MNWIIKVESGGTIPEKPPNCMLEIYHLEHRTISLFRFSDEGSAGEFYLSLKSIHEDDVQFLGPGEYHDELSMQ